MAPRRHLPSSKWGEVMAKKDTSHARKKVERVMKEYKKGELKSSSGEKITNRRQAIAVALSEAGLSKKDKS